MAEAADKKADLAWRLFVELRKETLEAQRIRAQIIGIKITFITAAVGLLISKLPDMPELMALPAIAAVFFDLLIISYSVSVKRIGRYIRLVLEPKLKEGAGWELREPLWEQYMRLPSSRQTLSFAANLGLTGLAAAGGLVALAGSDYDVLSVVLAAVILTLFWYDYRVHGKPRTIFLDDEVPMLPEETNGTSSEQAPAPAG